MDKILLLVVSIYICIILSHHVQAQDPEIRRCPTTSNYTSNSTYQTNLNRLLSSLVANVTRDGFFNDTVGTGPNTTVYGLVSCRGDLPMQDCGTCMDRLRTEILQVCPNGREGTIRYADCGLLRYSNNQFFSQVDNVMVSVRSGDIAGTDLARYNQELGRLMNNLSNAAMREVSRFESGTAPFADFRTIYGMVQCTRDLSPNNCFRCLQQMFTWIQGCCNASDSVRIFSATCNIRYELYPFLTVPLEPSPSPPSPPPPTDSDDSPPLPNEIGGSSTNVAAIVVPTVGGALLLLALCAYLIIRRRRNYKKTKPDIIYDQDDIRSEESLQFGLNTIRIATNDFSEANKLGEGGFGAVYRGELLDGREIAVKRLSQNSGQGSQEFKNEVVLLHKLQHRNLVRLLGFCLAGDEKLLIYEYVPNISLDKYIFNPNKKTELDWERRYKIIGGIARGLLYLHEDSRLRIIHRDLKAGNILLDEEMNAKIADFGMAKLFGVDQTQGNTNRIAGTFGYMAPEYAMHGLFSVKSDVFSFGVLLLEIISGQKTNHFHASDPSRDLLSYAWKVWREGEALKLIDPVLTNNFVANEVMRCIHIGLLCVQENLDERPTMSAVVLMLSSYSLTLKAPSAPAFISQTRSGAKDPTIVNESTSSSSLYSRDGISLSYPR